MQFQCQCCKAILDVDEQQAGRTVICAACRSHIQAPATSRGAGIRLGDFIILGEVGKGSTSTVYRAWQLSLDREAALKLPHSSVLGDSSFTAAFINEARMLSQLRHPNIVEGYALALAEDKTPMLAMEFVDGKSIRESVEQSGPLPWQKALEITSDIAQALAYISSAKGMLHRDIKAENILLSKDGIPKLADLGLLQRPFRTQGSTQELFGTPQCMAPELVYGEAPSEASDIYALGATLFFMLTGCYPYQAEKADAIIDMHLGSALPCPESIIEGISPNASEICRSMLAKRPGHRYASYAELLDDIRLALAGKPPRHKPAEEFQAPLDISQSNPFEVKAIVQADGYSRLAKLWGTLKALLEEDSEVQGQQAVDIQHAPATEKPHLSACAMFKAALSGRNVRIACVAALLLLFLMGTGAYLIHSGIFSATSPYRIRKLIARKASEAEINGELKRLQAIVPMDSPKMKAINDAAAEYLETLLEEKRSAEIGARQSAWNAALDAEKAEMEKRLAAAQKREEEEAARLEMAKEAKRFEEQLAAFRNVLTAKINQNDFNAAKQALKEKVQAKTAQETEAIGSWQKVIDDAERFYAFFLGSNEKFANCKVPLLAKNKAWKIAKIDSDTIIFVHPSTQLDKEKLTDEDMVRFPIGRLLPPQYNFLAKALVETRTCNEKEAERLLWSFLLCKGVETANAEKYFKGNDPFIAGEALKLSSMNYVDSMLLQMEAMTSSEKKALANKLRNLAPEETRGKQDRIQQLLQKTR